MQVTSLSRACPLHTDVKTRLDERMSCAVGARVFARVMPTRGVGSIHSRGTTAHAAGAPAATKDAHATRAPPPRCGNDRAARAAPPSATNRGGGRLHTQLVGKAFESLHLVVGVARHHTPSLPSQHPRRVDGIHHKARWRG